MMIRTALSIIISPVLRRLWTCQRPVTLDPSKEVAPHGLARPFRIARPDGFRDFGVLREKDLVPARQWVHPAHDTAELHARNDPAADLIEEGLEPAVVGGLRDRHVKIEIGLVGRLALLHQSAENLKLGLDFRLLGGRTAQCGKASRLDLNANPEFEFLDDIGDLVRCLREEFETFRILAGSKNEDTDTMA